jgi:tetratricopeptide (TPR) repeat protein
MNVSLRSVFALAALLASALLPQPAIAAEAISDLDAARRTGWKTAFTVIEKLDEGDHKDFPGIEAWLKDFRKQTQGLDCKAAPEKWPAVDIEALVTHNPNFWRAQYEIRPGDPGMGLLHAGLLLGCGEAARAMHVIEFYGFRPGIPKEIGGALAGLHQVTKQARKKADALTEAGIELFDKGDYAGAVKKYRESLKVWPQNGWAYYELGYTLRTQEQIAAGEKPMLGNAIQINPKNAKFSAEVSAAFSNSRRYAPFQDMAYQGNDQAVIQGLFALGKKVQPAMKALIKADDPASLARASQQLSEGCQEASIHDLALVSRQLLVACRGRYDPSDHPFITTSLRKLAPGPETDATLKRLAGGKTIFWQLIPTEDKARP